MSDLDRARELLPFHAQGVLTGQDLAFMHQWIEANGASHPEVEAELEWLRSASRHLRAEAEAACAPAAAALPELMRRVALEGAGWTRTGSHSASKSVLHAPFLAMFARLLGVRASAWIFGLAALVLVQAGVIGWLLWDAPAEQAPMQGGRASVATPAGSVLLVVAFSAGAREVQIRGVLERANAQIVAGPSSLGMYTVAVPQAGANGAAAILRAAAGVVESVQLQ